MRRREEQAQELVSTGRLLASYRVSVSALARCTHRYPPISDGLVLGVSSRLGGAGQRLGVDILPNLRQFAFSNSNVENPVVPERLIGGLDFPRGDADGQNPVSLRDEFGRLWV